MRFLPFSRRDEVSTSSGENVSSYGESVSPYAGYAIAVADPEPVDVPAPRERRSKELWPKRVGAKDLMQFSRQLAAFIRAGIPILDGLALLEEDTENPTLKRTIAAVADLLRTGSPLSEALGEFPKVFPVAYRSMLRSAELTGQLDVVLDRVADYLERDVEARSKIRAALVYPAIIVVMSIGVVILLSTFVLPKFKVFFNSFHQQLPLPTRLLLGFAGFVGTWWWALLIALAGATAAIVWWVKSPSGRLVVDRVMLRIPVAGDALRFAMVERFCRVLASMLQAGVALPEAIDVSGAAMNNRHVVAALGVAREEIMQGAGIAGPLARTAFFPSAATQMLRVGEDTGQLDTQLEYAATYYSRELDYKIKRLTSLFEPAVLIFMGVVVGFVAIALVSAMYGIFTHTGSLK